MTTQVFLEAAAIYRDSPNTFGHEEVDDQRRLLKKVLGLVASQRMLQDSLAAGRSEGYYDASVGMKHLWERLQGVEDDLRSLEKQYGEKLNAREYATNPGGQGVPVL